MPEPMPTVAPLEAGGAALLIPRMVPVPGGRLEVSAASGAARTLEISAFQLGQKPVTNREYASFLAAGRAAAPPWWNDPNFSAPGQPVVGVTWHDAAAFCAWLSEIAGGRWRLPTEAEWEHAACGGLASPRTAWGETIPPVEIPEGPLSGPWEAGLGTPNGYGLYDMGTIVHEWCANPHGPDPRRRASRGGSWRHRIRWSSPTAASSLPPGYRYSDYGFRVLRELDG
ncbi:MAG: formylglycine-generating enzyme family protein [Thermoanaerobaculia bacterium]